MLYICDRSTPDLNKEDDDDDLYLGVWFITRR